MDQQKDKEMACECPEERDHVLAIDVSCSCGESLKGAWSGEEVDAWHETHQRHGAAEWLNALGVR